MPDHGPRNDLPVVAIGASAGGLEACRTLVKKIPGDLAAAFILVMHLDPSHESMVVDLLSGHTALKVVEAAEGMALQAGYLYVIPPGQFMSVAQRMLHLASPEGGKKVRLPFDVLLRSLAKDAGAASACIVLSGTGTDGSLGIADIRAAGGLVIAGDPAEAEYPGMPESAIETDHVAHILRTDKMPDAIATFVANGSVSPVQASDKPVQGAGSDDPNTAGYDEVLAFVARQSKQDISLYKRGTLERRVARRMSRAGFEPDETGRYLALLRSDAEELAQLTADLLIHVTSFFRDPAVFDHLSQTTLPALLDANTDDHSLRIWVAGCSSGEEAYSLAMVCLEALETSGSDIRLQIFASDINPEEIAKARVGFYPKEIEKVVSAERLARFFVPDGGGWRVTSQLRDVIVFTVADILSDPPFSKIDLVSCRNVLIYLGTEAQKRVVARCCFALRPGGLLLLGAAEAPSRDDDCFAIEDKAARLWRRVGQSNAGDRQLATSVREDAAAATDQTHVRRTALGDLCRRIVLENYAPAAVLLNSQFECLYSLGPTEKYLKTTQRPPNASIVEMLPEGLRARFRAAAATCSPTNPRVTVSGGGVDSATDFDIALHSVTAGTERLLLACFVQPPRPTQSPNVPVARNEGTNTADLEAVLEATRSDLYKALRDLELEVEAHSADAAEALSVNEEFQSTNEELLASKEELQSLNEELTALNSQLQETSERYRTTANDLQNVLYSTDVATLFLDNELSIRFFTPGARAVFRLIPTDVGRPLADLASVSGDEDLHADTRSVLETFNPTEREVAGTEGRWFQRRVLPYRADGDRVEGVVITYLDITESKRTQAALMAAREAADHATRSKSRFLAAASHDLRQPLQSMALLHQLLARSGRSTEGARFLALLDQTLQSMTGMLDSLLDVNRIDSGVVTAKVVPVPIAPILQRLADEFRPLCDLKGLKLRLVACAAWVCTDGHLLEQILRNLLSNALKYTPKGGILLGCRRSGTDLKVVVCDSGIGVMDSETKEIFEAYRQGEKAAAISGAGLGLGLSIVQRLADLLEHPVSLRSTPGKGSSFMISLPITEAETGGPHASQDISGPLGTARQTGMILLVEDEATLRELLANVLTKEGHTVIAKADAKEALAWASGAVARPDLLLTDFELRGGTSGLKLAQDLQNVVGGAVPAIILTGDITVATTNEISRSACHQIAKPVMPETLLAQVSNLMLAARGGTARPPRDARTLGTTVHVIDDDAIIRETLRRLFEAERWTVVTYASAEEFLAAPRPGGAACLLVDALLPGMDGVALVKKLRSEGLDLPAVMLTGHGDAAMAVAAMKAGASDLIEKPASAADLIASLRHAIEAGSDGHTRTASRKSAETVFANLTAREHAVLKLVLEGKPNKIIAAELEINQRTVENHRAAVMRKTGAESLPALVRLSLAAEM